jgi:hypothetical protein
MTFYIIKVKGMAEYKLIDDEFMFKLQHDTDFQKDLDWKAIMMLDNKFEYEVVSVGPAPLIADRHQNYFVSQN